MNELFEAVKKGDAEVVKSLLATGALVDAVNQYGSTPLHWAAKNGYESVVQVLLATGALVDAVNQYGYTPLHWAAKNGYEAVVQALLAGGADPNIRGFKVYTPLHWAAKNGYEAVVDLLLEAGADIKLLKKDSVERELCQNILNGLLRSAVISNNIVKVQAYIAIGAGVNATDDDGDTALIFAAENGYEAIVNVLVRAGALVDAVSQNRETPLHLAAKKGDEAVVNVLVQAGANPNTPNEHGNTALHRAAIFGHAAIVNVLVRAGADLNIRGWGGCTPLYWAAARGHAAIVNVLVRAGADINAASKTGYTPLHWAALRGHAAIVNVLVQAGALVDAVSQNRKTPLHLAAKNGYAYEAVVDLLLEAGADIKLLKKDSVERELCQNILNGLLRSAVISNNIVKVQVYIAIGAGVNATDDDGAMPLHLAAKNGNEAVVDLLLEAGADIKLLKKDSVERELCQNILNGLLRSAVISNNIVKVQVYIAIGAGVNATDDDGAMPLHQAAGVGYTAAVKALVKAGAEVNAVSQNRETPLHLAAKNGHEAVVQALLAKGADVNAENQYGYTPLHWAAARGHAAIVNVLVRAGADINAASKTGYTPLRIARDGPTYDAIKAYIDSKQHQWRRHLQALRSSALHQQKTSNFHLVELFPDNIKRKFIASFFERLSPLLAFSKILNPRLAEGNKENSSPAASVALDIVKLIAGFIEPRIPTLLNVISRSLKDHPEVLEVYAKVLESLNQLQSYINTHTGKKERQKAALDIQEKLLALTESRKIFNSENVLEEIIANLTEESYAEVFKTHSVNKVISFFPLAGGCELAYTKLEGVLASIQKIFSPDSVGINFNKLKDSLQAQAQPEPEVAAAQPEPVASPEAVASPEPEPKEAEAGRPAATTTFFVAAAAEAVGAAGSASPEPDGTELKVVC